LFFKDCIFSPGNCRKGDRLGFKILGLAVFLRLKG